MSFLKKMKLAIDTAAEVSQGLAQGEEFRVSDEEKEKRMAVCKGCPHYIETMGQPRCNECGCFMALKTALNKAKCPIGKW